ncbi:MULTISPECIES: DUF1616 domain-containing protein [Fervidicoccus]|uniref:DUF1616 domain-containing protein n=2 Tax=Fervidicoccus fontis TaxID=683846 RepID=I0A0L4_FERFK|nr:hypothetical protein FFONT_0531 [Fervidicoccus fontis Kam940]
MGSLEETLEDYIARKKKNKKTEFELKKEVFNEFSSRNIYLVDPNPPLKFSNYITRMEYSLWFWTVLSFTLVSLTLIYVTNFLSILMPLRYIFGSIFVLFLPGYSLVEALYPGEGDLSPLERLALSIGLSLAVVPLIGLLLNYTPFGIRLLPIAASLSMFIIILSVYALYRKFSINSLLVASQKKA